MTALSVGLAWMALASVAFLALSASAFARTRQDLERHPRESRARTARAGGEPENLHYWLPAGTDVSVTACRHYPNPRGYAGSFSRTPSTSWGPGLAM